MRGALVARGALAIVLAVGMTFSSSSAFAQQEDKEKAEAKPAATESEAPEVRYPPFSTRFMVLTGGIFITGAAWGFAFAASRGWPENQCHITVAGPFDAHGQPCVSGPPGSAQLGIPVVGPWIALGKSGCASDEPNCDSARVGARGVGYVVDGIVQAAGVALFIQGLVMKTDAISSGKKPASLSFRYGDVKFDPIPLVSHGMSGVGITGTF
jgi:hypothetical protein